jgi:hypothetical protein
MPPPTGLVINAGVTVNAGVTLNGFVQPVPITYTGWPTEFYYQGVYLYSSTNLQINNETNAAALWAVYNTLTPGTPISFIINNTPYYTTIADPARGGGGMIAPYISIVATTVFDGIVSSVTIG